jgi:hypothetical protein
MHHHGYILILNKITTSCLMLSNQLKKKNLKFLAKLNKKKKDFEKLTLLKWDIYNKKMRIRNNRKKSLQIYMICRPITNNS